MTIIQEREETMRLGFGEEIRATHTNTLCVYTVCWYVCRYNVCNSTITLMAGIRIFEVMCDAFQR